MPDFNVSNKLSELEQLKSLVHFYHGLNSPFSLRFDIAITSFSKLMKINDPNSTEENIFISRLARESVSLFSGKYSRNTLFRL